MANLHAGVSTLCVGVFFWVYAEFIMRYVPLVRLSREVNLLPYFLCMIGGMALAGRALAGTPAKASASWGRSMCSAGLMSGKAGRLDRAGSSMTGRRCGLPGLWLSPGRPPAAI